MDAPDDVANTASQAASAVARTILTSAQTLTGGHLTRTFRWELGEHRTVRPIHLIAVTMQLDAFVDERIKFCNTLSFM